MSVRNFLMRGAGGDNYEIGRLLWAMSALAGIGYTGAHLVLNHTFDIMQFGGGMALIMSGGGIGIGAKDAANKSTSVSAGGVQ